MNTSPFWTDRRIEALREAIREGLSSTQIGALLGCSRAAVSGKAHRLGLMLRFVNEDTGKQRAIRLERRRTLYAARKPAQAPFNALATSMSPNKRLPSSGHLSASEALPNSKPTPLLDLKPRQCRWPIGPSHPPGQMDQTTFCGAPGSLGKPYCAQRTERIVGPRQEFMALAYELPHTTFPMIARWLREDMDHTTVIHGRRQHLKRLAEQLSPTP